MDPVGVRAPRPRAVPGMAEPDDIEVGRRILDREILTREQLLDCLFETIAERRGERQRAFARPLGVLLLERGLITEDQFLELVGQRFETRKPHQKLSNIPMGEILVSLGYARRDQVQEALDAIERAGA